MNARLYPTRSPLISIRAALCCILCCILLAGCGIGISFGPTRKCPKDSAKSAVAQSAAVEHIVLIWLKEPGNAEHRSRLIETSKTLAQIPGVLAIRAGEVITSERSPVDSSFDVGITILFESETAMREYELNPLHRKAFAEVLLPVTQRFVVYDIKLEQ